MRQIIKTIWSAPILKTKFIAHFIIKEVQILHFIQEVQVLPDFFSLILILMLLSFKNTKIILFIYVIVFYYFTDDKNIILKNDKLLL